MYRFSIALTSSVLFLFACTQKEKVQTPPVVQKVEPQDTVRNLSILFLGDIMGHDSQIASAKVNDSTWDYNSVFQYIKPVFDSADLVIGNLELTTAGPPFKGYPQFSSPDTLLGSLKKSGVDILVTSNNHSCDGGKNGIVRTIEQMDLRQIPHTGTFKDTAEWKKNNPLIVSKNGITLALMNYTYGTNELPTPVPTVVNRLDSAQLIKDIAYAKSKKADEILMFVHWGEQYTLEANKEQKAWLDFFRKQGVRLVIGSHPHVVQPMEWTKDSTAKDQIVVYSLANFISNQRTEPRDGGVVVKLSLQKQKDSISVTGLDYWLTWVHTPKVNGKRKFFVLPLDQYVDSLMHPNEKANKRIKAYAQEAREVFKNNRNAQEMRFKNGIWVTEKGEENPQSD